MTWNNASARKCIAVWDVISKIYKAAGLLPEGRTPEELLSVKRGEMLDFGQSIADNDAVWADLPEHIVPSDADKHKRAQAACDIAKMSALAIDENVLNEMVAQAQQGVSRNELRECLRRTLAECR